MNGQTRRFEAVFRRVLVLLVMCWCGMAPAQVPRVLNYQGYLTNPGGTPINVPVVMTFRLYSGPTGGAALYTEIQPSVGVANGIFNAVIGSVTPLPLSLQFDVPYWLTVTINADGEMSPRQEVTASAYALRSANADALAPAATVPGAQITGAIVTGTLPTANLTGTVGTAQIANNAVTTAKLADGSVTLAKVNANGCTTNQIMKFDGAAWVCAGDSTPATVVGFAGAAGMIAGNSLLWVFTGPTANIVLAAPNTRLLGAGTASLGTSSGTATADIDLCFQLNGAGTVNNFSGGNYIERSITGALNSISATSTVTLVAGTYRVGYCVRNGSVVFIDFPDYMNGWVMATP